MKDRQGEKVDFKMPNKLIMLIWSIVWEMVELSGLRWNMMVEQHRWDGVHLSNPTLKSIFVWGRWVRDKKLCVLLIRGSDEVGRLWRMLALQTLLEGCPAQGGLFLDWFSGSVSSSWITLEWIGLPQRSNLDSPWSCPEEYYTNKLTITCNFLALNDILIQFFVSRYINLAYSWFTLISVFDAYANSCEY